MFQNLQATLDDNFSEIEFKIRQLESRISAIESKQHEDQATPLQVHKFSFPPLQVQVMIRHVRRHQLAREVAVVLHNFRYYIIIKFINLQNLLTCIFVCICFYSMRLGLCMQH